MALTDSAICIKKSLSGSIIDLKNHLIQEINGIGFELDFENSNFSFYESRRTRLNPKLFECLNIKYKNLIIICEKLNLLVFVNRFLLAQAAIST